MFRRISVNMKMNDERRKSTTTRHGRVVENAWTANFPLTTASTFKQLRHDSVYLSYTVINALLAEITLTNAMSACVSNVPRNCVMTTATELRTRTILSILEALATLNIAIAGKQITIVDGSRRIHGAHNLSISLVDHNLNVLFPSSQLSTPSTDPSQSSSNVSPIRNQGC